MFLYYMEGISWKGRVETIGILTMNLLEYYLILSIFSVVASNLTVKFLDACLCSLMQYKKLQRDTQLLRATSGRTK